MTQDVPGHMKRDHTGMRLNILIFVIRYLVRGGWVSTGGGGRQGLVEMVSGFAEWVRLSQGSSGTSQARVWGSRD